MKLDQLQQTLSLIREKTPRVKVGFANGCFDLLHEGHLSYLWQARAQCDFLIVALNDDKSVARLKGKSRPIQALKTRMANVAALEMVDAVVSFTNDTPLQLLEILRPDILIKGHDHPDTLGSDVVSAIVLAKANTPNQSRQPSTTKTIGRIQQ